MVAERFRHANLRLKLVRACALALLLASSSPSAQKLLTQESLDEFLSGVPKTESRDREALQLLLRAKRDDQMARSRSASAQSVVGSVAVAARCVEGYVASGRHRASAADVTIVTAEQSDCVRDLCRAYQVTANRDGGEPFDLEVSVTCSQ